MTDVFERLRACRVVPVVKFPNASCAEGLGRALLAAGLPCIEVTFRSAAAEEAIRILSKLPDLLVGAGTIRSDNPRLLVRSEARVAERTALGLPPTPMKVTVTECVELSPGARFFVTGDTRKLVYCSSESVARARDRLTAVATVVDGGQPVQMRQVSEDLYARGVRRLLVEGGGTVHTQLLTAGLADELQLVVAPFFVGDSRAPRFVDDGRFPWSADRHARLAEVRQIGEVVLLRYALSARFCPD